MITRIVDTAAGIKGMETAERTAQSHDKITSCLSFFAMQWPKTQFVDINASTTLAYRRVGLPIGIPLVMHIHFRGNMDFWDPVLINNLAAARPVIVFDQAGVGRSTGEVPQTAQGWADDIIAFVRALEIDCIDLLGFSMGGYAVQMAALTAPGLVRKLILAGTTASAPATDSNTSGIVWPREQAPPQPYKSLATAESSDEIEQSLAFSFFPASEAGTIAAKMYWNRINSQPMADGESPNLTFVDRRSGSRRQAEASRDWNMSDPRKSFDRLAELKIPVLVMNGDNDLLIPSSRSWELSKGLPHAQLIIYPSSGHGFLHQYAGTVAAHINMFLDDEVGANNSSKL